MGQASCLRTTLALLSALLGTAGTVALGPEAVAMAFQFALAWGIGAIVSPPDRALCALHHDPDLQDPQWDRVV